MDMTKFSTLIAMLLSASAGLPDEVQLFNGKDLDGWVAEGVREFVKDGRTLPVWSVKDGHLVGTSKGFGFLRYDRRTFADFVFHVEFRMAPGCNSGLGIPTARSTRLGPGRLGPRSMAMRSSCSTTRANRRQCTRAGHCTDTSALARMRSCPQDSGNSIDIKCAGPRIKVTLNGEQIVDVDQQKRMEALRQKPLSGYVCLQNHAGTIEFRELRVRVVNGSRTKA